MSEEDYLKIIEAEEEYKKKLQRAIDEEDSKMWIYSEDVNLNKGQ